MTSASPATSSRWTIVSLRTGSWSEAKPHILGLIGEPDRA